MKKEKNNHDFIQLTSRGKTKSRHPVTSEAFSFLPRIWNAVKCGYSLTKGAQTSTDSHISDNGHSSCLLVQKKRKDWDYPQGMFVSWASDSVWIKREKKKRKKNSTVPQLGTQTFCMCLPFPPGWRTLWNYYVALQSCLCFSWTFATFPIFYSHELKSSTEAVTGVLMIESDSAHKGPVCNIVAQKKFEKIMSIPQNMGKIWNPWHFVFH